MSDPRRERTLQGAKAPPEVALSKHNFNVTFWCSYARDRILEENNPDRFAQAREMIAFLDDALIEQVAELSLDQAADAQRQRLQTHRLIDALERGYRFMAAQAKIDSRGFDETMATIRLT